MSASCRTVQSAAGVYDWYHNISFRPPCFEYYLQHLTNCRQACGPVPSLSSPPRRQVSEMYRRLGEQMAPMSEASEESVPPSWQDLVHIKEVHYSALAHNHFAIGECKENNKLC